MENTTLPKKKTLTVIKEKGMFAGVLAGVSYYMGWPVTIVRIAFCLGLMFGFPILAPAYILTGLIAKDVSAPADYDEVTA